MQALILLPYTNVKLKGTTLKERQLLWWGVRKSLYFCSGIKNKQSLANLLIPDTFLSAIEKIMTYIFSGDIILCLQKEKSI